VFDFDLGVDVRRRFQQTALQAHRALGCRDFSRVDFRLGAEGEPFVLEVNSIPGLTSHSLVPKAARRAGISFPGLVGRVVAFAAARRSSSRL